MIMECDKMIMSVIFEEQSCNTCVHRALCEDFPECPFFEKEEESEECKNWMVDLNKI